MSPEVPARVPAGRLLWVYAAVPLAAVAVAIDSLAEGTVFGWIEPPLPWAVVYSLFFGMPHILGSLFAFADPALRRPVQRWWGPAAALVALAVLTSVALMERPQLEQWVIVATMVHVLGQQSGLAAGQAQLPRHGVGGWLTRLWRWTLAAACTLTSLAIGGEALRPVVDQPMPWLQAGGVLLALATPLAAVLAHQAWRRGADIRALLATHGLAVAGFLCVSAGWPLLGVGLIRWTHDATAFVAYGALASARYRADPRANWLYRPWHWIGLREIGWTLWPMATVMALLLSLVLPEPVSLALIFIHYAFEHRLWRRDSPWRRWVRLG